MTKLIVRMEWRKRTWENTETQRLEIKAIPKGNVHQAHSGSSMRTASAWSAAASRERCLCVPVPDEITLPSTVEKLTNHSDNQLGQLRTLADR